MPEMTMRQRILAVVHSRELDQIPFIIYDDMLPMDEVERVLGPGRIGLMRWSEVHKVITPHCRFQTDEYWVGKDRWQRIILHTPVGSIFEERQFEPVFNSSSIKKHFVQERKDYEVLWYYLQDSIIVEDFERYYRDQAELGDRGVPLVSVERTPYQNLWIMWVGLDNLSYHLSDFPECVEKTMGMLENRERKIFEIVRRSPVEFIDFPDNITAQAIGPVRFKRHCTALYDELAEILGEKVPVFVHMDGNLKPLWQAIAESRVRGLDSFTPAPDNDTRVSEAVALWPEMRLFVNFPSSLHLCTYDQVRAEAEEILAVAGHSGRLQIQISENVPLDRWQTSFPAIADAIEAFGVP